MELEIWKGDWGLPSIDRQCLTVMAYCKFSEVPITFLKTNNPWWSPNGELPVLKNEQRKITNVESIINFFRKENWGTDHDLSRKQSADIVAFSALMEEKLLPALLQLWWSDEKTYVDLTRPWYAKALPLPFNFFLPGRYQRASQQRLAQAGPLLSDTDREKKIYKDAKECLNILSTRLGGNDYFFGKTPSSLDAIVYGYLAPLLKAPFPNLDLQNHLKSCHNLVQLCNKITTKYFPLSDQEQEELRQREEAARQKRQSAMGGGGDADDSEFPHKKRNMVLAGLVAGVAMASYALLSGLVQIEIVDEEKEMESMPVPVASPPPNFEQFEGLFEEEGQKEKGGGKEQ